MKKILDIFIYWGNIKTNLLFTFISHCVRLEILQLELSPSFAAILGVLAILTFSA